MKYILSFLLFLVSIDSFAQDKEINLIFLAKLIQDSSINSISITSFQDTTITQKSLINKKRGTVSYWFPNHVKFDTNIESNPFYKQLTSNVADTVLIDTNGNSVTQLHWANGVLSQLIEKTPSGPIYQVDTTQLKYNSDLLTHIIMSSDCKNLKTYNIGQRQFKCKDYKNETTEIVYKNDNVKTVKKYLLLKNGEKATLYNYYVKFIENHIYVFDKIQSTPIFIIEFKK
jgi:hypothetical protein